MKINPLGLFLEIMWILLFAISLVSTMELKAWIVEYSVDYVPTAICAVPITLIISVMGALVNLSNILYSEKKEENEHGN